ncbi:MAG: DUF3450 domain-containing protein [Gammaproteobacteria bacterium]|nr:DUF3450 domain-containing protein [Gammaproteobacteria bacterium]
MNQRTTDLLRAALLVGCAAGVLCANGTALAAETDKVNSTIGEQAATEEAAVASQKKIERMDDEATKAAADYRRMVAEAQSLRAYNDQLELQVKSQEEEIADMTTQLDEIQTTSREVLPLMSKMLATLQTFVELDVPFLMDERKTRLAQLDLMMSRADVSTSEKYRRLVEAYQIEVEYGRTIEAYQGKVGEKTVEFLRTGRVSLMYQTLDGKETGYWDTDAKDWVVDESYREAMIAGLKVAKKQAAPDFLSVAIHAPKEVM